MAGGQNSLQFDLEGGSIVNSPLKMKILKERRLALRWPKEMERKRSERALIGLVEGTFINGVSLRKIKRLARPLGIEGISASQVSEMTKGLDERMKEFRTSSLSEEYLFVWIDVIYEKVRWLGFFLR